MKNYYFYLLVIAITLLGCNKPIAEEEIQGLWVNKNWAEKQYFFSGDSLFHICIPAFKYKLTPRRLTTYYEHEMINSIVYSFDKDILIFSYGNNGIIGDFREYYKKIPYRSLIEGQIDSLDIKINFHEQEVNTPYYTNTNSFSNDSSELKFYIGSQKENPDNLFVIHSKQKSSLDSINIVFANTFNRFKNQFNYKNRGDLFQLYIDKNLTFSEYNSIKKTFLINGIYNINFNTQLKFKQYQLPEKLRLHSNLPLSFLITSKEANSIIFPENPPQLEIPSKKSLIETKTHVSWKNQNKIFINKKPILKDSLHSILKKEYLKNTNGNIFILSPSSASKLDTYLLIRSTIQAIHQNSINEYIKTNYNETSIYSLSSEVREKIEAKFIITEQLKYNE